jgi:single-strand DNA-binding protein
MNRHNHCFVVGNLGMDPVERGKTPNGPVVKLTVAENITRFNEETRQFETLHTNWFQVTAFSPLAERVLQLRKGEKVAVQGRMKVSKFTDRSGEERTGFEILAEEIAIWKGLPAVAAVPAQEEAAGEAPVAMAAGLRAAGAEPARGRVVKRVVRAAEPPEEAVPF